MKRRKISITPTQGRKKNFSSAYSKHTEEEDLYQRPSVLRYKILSRRKFFKLILQLCRIVIKRIHLLLLLPYLM